jgi:putative transposase
MGEISDEFWELVSPLLVRRGRMGRPTADLRLVLEGIAWRYRTGSPWRDLPAEFGSWKTVWQRHHLYSFDGTYQRMLDAVAGWFELVPDADEDGDDEESDHLVKQLISVDSTITRAHQHAAGARRVPGRVAAALARHTGG